jgi:hypothetical protein
VPRTIIRVWLHAARLTAAAAITTSEAPRCRDDFRVRFELFITRLLSTVAGGDRRDV